MLPLGTTLIALMALPLSASVIYQQDSPYAPPNGATGVAWTSTTSGADGGYQAFDNFTLSTTANVKTIQWIGFYRDDITDANNPVLPATVTWDLSFWTNNAGAPGTSLYDVQEPAASVTTSQLGTTLRGVDTVYVYEFTATLPTDFSAAANTTYWFSPLSLQTSSDPIFVWLNGTGGDGASYQNQLNPDGTVAAGFSRTQDRAFALLNAPEPATAYLLAPVLLGMFGWKRRRGGPSRRPV